MLIIYEKEKGSKRIQIKGAGPERDHPRSAHPSSVDLPTSVVFLAQRSAKGFATIPPSDRNSITADCASSFNSTANACRKLQKYKIV
jgi:hypothetical protein